MDGSRLPSVQDPVDLEPVRRYAPILMCDRKEPFDVVAVGFTLFRAPAESDSFPRTILPDEYGASLVIEYALWWDWDIQHLYELEHVWSFVDAAGNLVASEASFHGHYVPIGARETLPRQGDHPVVFVQPGKHAMLSSPARFDVIREEATRQAGDDAGIDGLLVKDMFDGELAKSPEVDARIERYLRARAFTPTFEFTRRIETASASFLPWHVLRAWIPARCKWWMTEIAPALTEPGEGHATGQVDASVV